MSPVYFVSYRGVNMSEFQIRAGKKYWRTIHSIPKGDGTHDSCVIDTYCIGNAYEVTCMARQHALKKLLCAGLRGKGDELADLIEAGEALQRSIDEVRRKYEEEKKQKSVTGPIDNVTTKDAGPGQEKGKQTGSKIFDEFSLTKSYRDDVGCS